MSLLQAFIKKISSTYSIDENELQALYNGTTLPSNKSSTTCTYTFVKSVRKGQVCGKPSKVGTLCTKHSKATAAAPERREKVILVESEDEKEDSSYY